MIPDLESAEDFAVEVCTHQECTGNGPEQDVCCRILAGQISRRDAAITEREREDVRRILRNILEVLNHALAELDGARLAP